MMLHQGRPRHRVDRELGQVFVVIHGDQYTASTSTHTQKYGPWGQ
ncbi:hypothetical protein [Rhodococcus sp. (in: high G+C Gram-positive bacteria)]|nr:hypothetical protein [Rhodococcus sp. (in: high G+C Gram-positive bacteria)]